MPTPFVDIFPLDETPDTDSATLVYEPDLKRVENFGYHRQCPTPVVIE